MYYSSMNAPVIRGWNVFWYFIAGQEGDIIGYMESVLDLMRICKFESRREIMSTELQMAEGFRQGGLVMYGSMGTT